jgi:hypothetical protein
MAAADIHRQSIKAQVSLILGFLRVFVVKLQNQYSNHWVGSFA